jgi:type I restriction enzyme S subunit
MNNWKTDKLKSLGYFQYGYTATATKINSGVKYLRISDIPDTGKINWQTVPFCKIPDNDFSKYSLINGDVLFARIGATAGKTCYIESAPKSIFASYLIRFVTNELDSKFFFYFTQSPQYWKQALQKREGQLKKGLNANTLSNFNIQYPENKLEQAAIVNILSTVDEAIQKADEAITKTERIKQTMMQKLLTEGIGHREFKQTKIGKIPKEWGCIKFNKCINVLGGFAFKSNDYTKSGIPLIQIANVSFGVIRFDDLKYLPQAFAEKYKEYRVNKNDILLALTRPIINGGLKASIINSEHTPSLLNQRVAKLKTNDEMKLRQNFLKHFVSTSYFFNQMLQAQTSTNQPNVSTGQINNFLIIVPSPDEQDIITNYLEDITEKLHLSMKRKAKIERIKQGLMDDLLTGKKRVKIN